MLISELKLKLLRVPLLINFSFRFACRRVIFGSRQRHVIEFDSDLAASLASAAAGAAQCCRTAAETLKIGALELGAWKLELGAPSSEFGEVGPWTARQRLTSYSGPKPLTHADDSDFLFISELVRSIRLGYANSGDRHLGSGSGSGSDSESSSSAQGSGGVNKRKQTMGEWRRC